MVFSQYDPSICSWTRRVFSVPQKRPFQSLINSPLGAIYNALAIGILALLALLSYPLATEAKELTAINSQATEQVLEPIPDLPLSGNYCVAYDGVSLHDPPHSGEFELDIAGRPVRAYWFWTGRSIDSPIGDDTIVLNIENVAGVEEVEIRAQKVLSARDRIYTWHSNSFSDDTLEYVTGGLNRYSISGFSINNDAKYNHGVGVVVIYESDSCPYTRINGWSGLDSFHWTRTGELGPDSNIMCDVFPASTMTRTLNFNLAIGGVASSDRGNSIWYITGKGEQPSVIAPDANGQANPSAIEIFDPLNGIPGREWDINSSMLTIPAGDTYACVQIESPEDDDGISAVWSGLINAIPLDPPDVTIQKEAEPSTIQAGESVTFTIALTNSGAISLTDVLVTDPLVPDCNRSFPLIEVGSALTYTCTITAVTESFTNLVEVIAFPPYGNPVTDQDDATVTVISAPTPTPSPTPSPFPTPSSTPTESPSPTSSPSPTVVITATPPSNSTPLPSPTVTSSPTPSSTSTSLPTPTPLPTETVTPTDVKLGAIGDRVWLDADLDGLQDESEVGVSEVAVSLYTEAGELISSTTTSADGSYLFSDLQPDSYLVEFDVPSGHSLTKAEQGDDAIDSNPDPQTGRTDIIRLSSGQEDMTIDAGLTGIPNLVLSKKDAGSVAQPGSTIIYTLNVTNTGNTTALDVVIVEFMPDNTTFYKDGSDPDWICQEPLLGDTQCTLDVGNLAPSETFQTTFAVKIDTPLPVSVTVINNQATVNSTNGISGKQAVTEITPLTPTLLSADGEPSETQYLFVPLIQ